MNITAAQIACWLGDLKANLLKIRDFSARAKEAGGDRILFQEMIDTGYCMRVVQAYATPRTTGVVPAHQGISKAKSIAIVCGVSERDSKSIYNSQVLVDRDGQVIAKYRTTHLCPAAPVEEHKLFSPGNDFNSLEFGDLRLGLSICYDLRFPELYRKLAVEHKSNVFVISSAWPFPRLEHFRTLALARAIENQSYVIAANRVGTDDGVTFCGSSAIVHPYGVIMAAASHDREELIQAELSLDRLNSVRRQIDILAGRRRHIYE